MYGRMAIDEDGQWQWGEERRARLTGAVSRPEVPRARRRIGTVLYCAETRIKASYHPTATAIPPYTTRPAPYGIYGHIRREQRRERQYIGSHIPTSAML